MSCLKSLLGNHKKKLDIKTTIKYTAGDYSEQQLVDCGYEKNGASGCNGAWPYSYIKTIADDQLDLTAEVIFLLKTHTFKVE